MQGAAMPKVNVYLPDDLAVAVRSAGLPVSVICQTALRQALWQVDATQKASDDRALELSERLSLSLPATRHLASAIDLAFSAAQARGQAMVETEHLLLGLLEEGENLAVMVIEAQGVDVASLKAALEAVLPPVAPGQPGQKRQSAAQLSPAARAAIANADKRAAEQNRPVIGCEQLLVALLSDESGLANTVMAELGLDVAHTRDTVTAALVGAAFSRGSVIVQGLDLEAVLAGIIVRLQRIEKKLDVP
jgi:Clp amino terminal domain, pathogenicity island component